MKNNLRRLEESFSSDLRLNSGMTLILIQDDVPCYGNTAMLKDDIVAAYKATGGLLMLAWTGNYRTDVFEMTLADLEKNYYRSSKGVRKDS